VARKLTKMQAEVLRRVARYERPPSSRQVADGLETTGFRRPLRGTDEVRRVARTLERRGLLAREGERPIRWTLTDAGRSELG
jgi:repressor of nif and glnA expression